LAASPATRPPSRCAANYRNRAQAEAVALAGRRHRRAGAGLGPATAGMNW